MNHYRHAIIDCVMLIKQYRELRASCETQKTVHTDDLLRSQLKFSKRKKASILSIGNNF